MSKIYIKPQNKGKLHRALGVPKGQKIPMNKLTAAKKSKSSAIRKEANFAVNARGFRHPKSHQEFEDLGK